jgi:hypothetical protein
MPNGGFGTDVGVEETGSMCFGQYNLPFLIQGLSKGFLQ